MKNSVLYEKLIKFYVFFFLKIKKYNKNKEKSHISTFAGHVLIFVLLRHSLHCSQNIL